jgi:nucleotide-binding universal stress UspA family protein
MLLVGTKPWDKPIRFAATVDVADPEAATVARGILQAAGFLAHGLRGTLDILYSERELKDETIRMERAVKLAQLVREFHVGCERLQMFGGDPEQRLPPLIQARQYDLLVLGAVSHREGLQFPGHTLTDKLSNSTEGDVVLVRGGSTALERADHAVSAREKTAHQREQFV